MADDRLQYQAPFMSAKEMPNVNVDNGSARYMNTLSNVFLTNANNAHQKQLASDLEYAKTEGERVGYSNGKNFQPSKPDSLFARQYNASGVTSAMENIQIDTQKSVKDYYLKNKMNPTGLEKSLKKYSEGYVGNLAPEMQTPVKMQLDKMGAAVVEQAADNYRSYQLQVAAAKFEQYDREMENTLEVIAPSMFSGGDVGRKAQESVAQLRENYIATLAQHGPAGKYFAGGYDVDGSGKGSGAMNPVEVAKKLQDFDMRVISAGVYGNFIKEAEKGRGVDAYMSFVKGDIQVTALNKEGKLENMKVSDFMTNDEMEKVASKMRQYSSGVDSMEDAVYRKWDRAQARTSDDFKREGLTAAYNVEKQPDGSSRIVGGDPVKLQALIASGLENPMVKPEAIKELQDLAEKLGMGDIDNPMIAAGAKQMVAEGLVQSYRDLPQNGLSDETRIKLHEQIDSRLKGQDWSSSTRFRQVTDYAESVLAPAKSAGFNVFGDNAGDKAAAADLAEWKRRMTEEVWAAQDAGILPANPSATPGKLADGRAEFDFRAKGKELAEEIASRRAKPTAEPPAVTEINTRIKEVETKMNTPQPGDDADAIAEQYRALMEEKAQLQARSLTTP